jgi:hypothetical protein
LPIRKSKGVPKSLYFVNNKKALKCLKKLLRKSSISKQLLKDAEVAKKHIEHREDMAIKAAEQERDINQWIAEDNRKRIANLPKNDKEMFEQLYEF